MITALFFAYCFISLLAATLAFLLGYSIGGGGQKEKGGSLKKDVRRALGVRERTTVSSPTKKAQIIKFKKDVEG